MLQLPVFLSAQETKLLNIIKGKLVSVESGNLFTIRDNEKKYFVRIAGIKSPTFSYRKDSVENLSKLAKGKEIILTVLTVEKDKENKEIIVATVEILGKDAALEQIQSGLAWILKDFTNNDKKAEYENAQNIAKEKKVGIWSDNFVPCKTEKSQETDPSLSPTSGKKESISDELAGSVNVEVLISEKGDVISAKPLCGHPMLQTLSAEAALKSKFMPTLISGSPVKVSGILIYNFTPK